MPPNAQISASLSPRTPGWPARGAPAIWTNRRQSDRSPSARLAKAPLNLAAADQSGVPTTGPHIAADMVALPELVGKPQFRLSPTSELLHGPARDIAVWTHGGSLNSGYVGANVQPRRPDLDRLTFASSLLELMQ